MASLWDIWTVTDLKFDITNVTLPRELNVLFTLRPNCPAVSRACLGSECICEPQCLASASFRRRLATFLRYLTDVIAMGRDNLVGTMVNNSLFPQPPLVSSFIPSPLSSGQSVVCCIDIVYIVQCVLCTVPVLWRERERELVPTILNLVPKLQQMIVHTSALVVCSLVCSILVHTVSMFTCQHNPQHQTRYSCKHTPIVISLCLVNSSILATQLARWPISIVAITLRE